MATFILFDIDGTLIDSGGSGMIALNRALEDVAGIKEGFQGINCAGKTDLQIIRETLTKHGLDFERSLVAEFRMVYLGHLQQAVARGLGHVKPGVNTLLQKLGADSQFFLGLLTGNTAEGARIKLEPFDLNAHFPTGAFGSDEEDRNRLLPLAVRRLRQSTGVSVDFSQCVVVGDTPRDVECAKAYGACSIAVATGPYGLPALLETEANLVLEDLSNTTRVVEWLRREFDAVQGE